MENLLRKFVDTRVILIFTIMSLFFHILYNIWRQYLIDRRTFKKLRNIKIPPAIPIFGHALHIIGSSPEEILKAIIDMYSTYGPNVFIKILNKGIVFIGKPEDIEKVLLSRSCLDKHEFYDFSHIVTGTGLLTAPAAKWHRNRKLMNPAFSRKALANFFPIFGSCASTFVNQIVPKYLGKRGTDWYTLFLALNSDTALQTIAGTDCDIQRNPNNLAEWIEEFLKTMLLRVSHFHYRPDFIFFRSGMGRKLLVLKQEIWNFMDKLLMERKSEFEENLKNTKLESFLDNDSEETVMKKSLLNFLLELNHKGTKFDHDDLRNEVITMFGAAIETTSLTTGFFLTMMGMFPDVQDRVFEEVQDAIGSDRVPTLEDTNKLTYMERCLKETLRLFPAAAIFLRENNGGDLEISDGIIPKGVSIAICNFCVHRSELYWEDPLKFDPDRFLLDRAAKRHPYTFIPFSGGLRNCIGQRYAYFSLKTTLSLILSKYRVHCDAYKSIDDIKLKIEVLLKPENGFEFWLEKRSCS